MSNEALITALRDSADASPPRPSAAQQASHVLREQIVDGRLTAGTRLTEEVVTGALGYSRNTIREAFVLLGAERLVEHRPHRGVFVVTPTARTVRELYALRRSIEPGAMWLSTSPVDPLRTVVDSARSAAAMGDLGGVAQANQLFHRGVVSLAGSVRISQDMEGALAEMRLVFRVFQPDPSFHLDFLGRNDEIVRLLETGRREQAGLEMRDYLNDAERRLLVSAPPEPTTEPSSPCSRRRRSTWR